MEIVGCRIMAKEFWKITEVIEQFQIKLSFLEDLEEEEIICPACREDSEEKLLSSDDMEKLRLARLLFEEMDVNMPGIEVILQMRQNMLDMRKQFDDILEDLANRLQDKIKRGL
jgi:MerR family transcriptional regulator/heat shock protein HspR